MGKKDPLLEFLKSIGLQSELKKLAKQQIDLEVLATLKEQQLIDLGLTLGAARKIRLTLGGHDEDAASAAAAAAAAAAPVGTQLSEETARRFEELASTIKALEQRVVSLEAQVNTLQALGGKTSASSPPKASMPVAANAKASNSSSSGGGGAFSAAAAASPSSSSSSSSKPSSTATTGGGLDVSVLAKLPSADSLWLCKRHRLNAHHFFVSYRVASNAREAETLAYALGAGDVPQGFQAPLKCFLDKHCLVSGKISLTCKTCFVDEKLFFFFFFFFYFFFFFFFAFKSFSPSFQRFVKYFGDILSFSGAMPNKAPLLLNKLIIHLNADDQSHFVLAG